MIEDNLSPDEKITGNLQVNGSKYILTLRLLDVGRGGGVVEQKEVGFTNNQLDYFLGEITRSLLDSSYAINMEGAPKDFEPQRIDLGNIQFKEVEGVDLKILDFKTQDSKAEGILSILNPELQLGDTQFRNRMYENALSTYINIQKSLDNSLSDDSKSAIQEYYSGVQKRIENTRTNLITERLNTIDSRFKKLPPTVNAESLEQFIQDYNKEIVFMKSQKYTNITLLKSILERVRKLELKIIELNEKEAEVMYDSYKFTETLRKYESIQKRIKETDRLDSSERRNLLVALDKKIAIVRETGFSYYANQIRTYCNLAEKEMFGINLKRGKGESIGISSVKSLIDKAKSIIEKNRLIDKSSIEYYNNTVQAINRSETIGTLLSVSDIGKEEGKEEISKIDFSFLERIPPNLYFPGSLHEEYGHTKTSDFVKIGFFSSLVLYGSQYLQYQSYRSSYSQKDNPFLDYLILKNADSGVKLLYYTSKNSELESISSQGERSAQLGNLFLLSTIGFYIYSWTPEITSGNAFSFDSLNIVIRSKMSPRVEELPIRETFMGLEGRF